VSTDYEQLAARYDEDRAQFSITRDEVIDGLLVAHATVRVLDVGTGTGRWLAAQREFFGNQRVEWLGLDPSPAMLREAKAKAMPGLIRAGAEALPLPDASCDYIATSYVFHHVVDKDRALDEVGRVLNGHGVFQLNNIEPAVADEWWLYRFFPEAVEIDAARFWSAGRIGDALEARRFSVDIVLDGGPQELPAADALADAERRVISQLVMLDDAAYARGLARLRTAAAAPEAMVTTTESRICLTARRAVSAG
jgi:SAM-dependent methyltransferase